MKILFVMPAQAGIQTHLILLGSRLRENDELTD